MLMQHRSQLRTRKGYRARHGGQRVNAAGRWRLRCGDITYGSVRLRKYAASPHGRCTPVLFANAQTVREANFSQN